MGGRKHSLNLIGPGRGQSPPVFFYNTYRFKKHNTYKFLYLENLENIYIYTESTLVLTRVCQTWAMHHTDTPTTLPELSSPIQSRWSESIISLYATSIIDCP